MNSDELRLVLISGRSGSGKSAALNTLEDAGFNCIDNLPPSLLPSLVNWMHASGNPQKIAVCIDARSSSNDLNQLPNIIDELAGSVVPEVLYLDADETILLQRFSATRRKHPLTHENLSLAEAIDSESHSLAPISDRATLKIDTSSLSVQELREQIRSKLAQKPAELALQFLSFGFKHGIPRDADLVFDVRCLPNPYWDKSLRMFTGKDKAIEDFLSSHDTVNTMFDDIKGFVEKWLPEYKNNQRSYLTVAIGCTGGQHRSVYLTEQMSKIFSKNDTPIQTRHRDLGHDHE